MAVAMPLAPMVWVCKQARPSGRGNTFNNALVLPYFSPSQYYWSNFGPNVELYRLAYTFKPTQDITITAGTRFYPSDIIDTNSWANSPTSDFGTYFFLNNPFIVPYAMNYLGGAGVAIQWNPNEGPFTVRALYLAAEPGRANSGIAPPSPGVGLRVIPTKLPWSWSMPTPLAMVATVMR